MFPNNQSNMYFQTLRQSGSMQQDERMLKLKTDIKTLETKVDLYKSLLTKCENSLEQCREQNKKLVKSNYNLESQVLKQVNNLENKHKKEIQDITNKHNTEISQLKRKYDDNISEIKKSKVRYNDKCYDLELEIQTLREDFRNKERKYEKDTENKTNLINEYKKELLNSKNIILELIEKSTDSQQVLTRSYANTFTSRLQSDEQERTPLMQTFEDDSPTETIESDPECTINMLNDILLHVENSGYTYNQISSTDTDMLNSSQRVPVEITQDFYEIIEEDVSGKLEADQQKYFYTIKVDSDIKLVTMVETFRWFTEQSSRNYTLLNTASNKQLSSTGKCIDILKLRTQLGNDKKRPRLCLTGRGVIMMCKEIIKATGDMFKDQINDILLVVPKLTWSLCEKLI